MFNPSKIKIVSAYLDGNNFWFNAEDYGREHDQNLFGKFRYNGEVFKIEEYIGCTNGGASWTSMYIKNTAGETVYSDHNHDGNGAWQTGDGQDARCEYSEMSFQIRHLFEKYINAKELEEEFKNALIR